MEAESLVASSCLDERAFGNGVFNPEEHQDLLATWMLDNGDDLLTRSEWMKSAVHFFRDNGVELPQRSELHLLQNAMVLANTLMVEKVLDEKLLQRMNQEDLRSLTPLFTSNGNPYGDFDLELTKPSFLEVV